MSELKTVEDLRSRLARILWIVSCPCRTAEDVDKFINEVRELYKELSKVKGL